MASLVSFDRKKLQTRPGITGLDEAGRGAFCGPVVAAAVAFEKGFYEDKASLRKLRGANDSKKLSAEARQELRQALQDLEHAGKLRTFWAESSVLEIAAHNILGATRLAMSRCLSQLAQGDWKESYGLAGTEDTFFDLQPSAHFLVLIDGLPLRPFTWQHEAIKAGDGRSLAIACASIIAKVERDQLMTELHESYPEYGFATHKGYGTPEHIAALQRLGPCPHHRHLFIQKFIQRTDGTPTESPELPFN